MENNKTLPKEILDAIYKEAERLYPYKEATVFNSGEIGIRERNHVDSYRAKFASNAIFGYSLKESSSNSTDELIKEVERLKGLIKDAYDVGYDASSYAHDSSLREYLFKPQSLEEFKTENKL